MNTCSQCGRLALHEDTPLCATHLVEHLAPAMAEERVALLDAQVTAITGQSLTITETDESVDPDDLAFELKGDR